MRMLKMAVYNAEVLPFHKGRTQNMSASHGSFLRDTRYTSAVVARGNYNYVKYNKIYNVCV